MHRYKHSPKATLAIVWLLLTLLIMISCKKEKIDNKAEDQEVLNAPAPNYGNYWTELGTPGIPITPSADDHNYCFSLNNKLYVVVRGYDQLWEFDPSNSQWTMKQSDFSDFTLSLYIAVFTNGNRVYFLNPNSKNFKEYNVTTNVWTNKADFPGTAKESVTYCHTASKGYIMGGINGWHTYGGPITVSENWEYDFAANTWTQKAGTPGESRYNSSAYGVGDKIYYGTGISFRFVIHPVTLAVSRVPRINKDWWEFNTLTNTWTQKADYGGGSRQEARGFVIGGKIYLGMGSTGHFIDYKDDFWSYNPASNSWTQRASYPLGSEYSPFHTLMGTGNYGYSVTGKIQFFWKYIPPFTLGPNSLVVPNN